MTDFHLCTLESAWSRWVSYHDPSLSRTCHRQCRIRHWQLTRRHKINKVPTSSSTTYKDVQYDSNRAKAVVCFVPIIREKGRDLTQFMPIRRNGRTHGRTHPLNKPHTNGCFSISIFISSQQCRRGYSNAVVRVWVVEWQKWMNTLMGSCVRHTLPCGNNTDCNVCQITFKLHIQVVDGVKRESYWFRAGSKVKVNFCHMISSKQKCCLLLNGVSTESQKLTSVRQLRQDFSPTRNMTHMHVGLALSYVKLLRILSSWKIYMCNLMAWYTNK